MTQHPDYEELPACIKAAVTEEEYVWMGDENRARLQEELTMPEYVEE